MSTVCAYSLRCCWKKFKRLYVLYMYILKGSKAHLYSIQGCIHMNKCNCEWFHSTVCSCLFCSGFSTGVELVGEFSTPITSPSSPCGPNHSVARSRLKKLCLIETAVLLLRSQQHNKIVYFLRQTKSYILIECVPEKSAVLGIIDQGCSPVVDCAWLPHVPQPFTLAIHRDTNNSAKQYMIHDNSSRSNTY